MQRSKAFTLIELLVVIAIIAILAAILFPVFAQAKVAAKRAAYLSNTKQMAIGFRIYASDFDDVYPLSSWTFIGGPSGTEAIHWVQRVFPYVKNSGIYMNDSGPKVNQPDMRRQDNFAAGPNTSVPLFFRNGLSETALESVSEFIVHGATGVSSFGIPNFARAGSEFNTWHRSDGWNLPDWATIRCQQRFDAAKDSYITGPDQGGFAFTWSYADSQNFAFADGSAKNIKKNAIRPRNMYPLAIPPYADPQNPAFEPVSTCTNP